MSIESVLEAMIQNFQSVLFMFFLPSEIFGVNKKDKKKVEEFIKKTGQSII